MKPRPLSLLSLSRYEEWTVIKRNRFGRKQERILGVDATKIYNRKPDRGRRYQIGVYRAERWIRDVQSIEFVARANDATFRIVYVDNDQGELVRLEYMAASAEDCAHIVSKVRYLRDRLGISDRHL